MQTGRVVGSVSHWPPEVCAGSACTKPGDCWALGVLLYALCALRLPFAGSCALAVVLSITEGRPAPLPSAYSRGLHDLCAALLRVDPARRLTAAGALSSPLLRAAQLEPEASDPLSSPLRPLSAPAALSPLPSASLLLVSLLLLLVLLVLLVS